MESDQGPNSRGQEQNPQESPGRLSPFPESLRNFRVLDPACGSGNFLYLALRTLKDIEHQIILEAEMLGLPPQFPAVGPESVHGIEINPYAAELARVTVWIGEIQWMLEHGRSLSRNPVLRPLDTIECRDALLNPDGTEAEWPKADVIVGNPPFLGGSKKRGQLGDAYFLALNAVYADHVPGGADLVCYWFEKARAQIAAGCCHAAGLVATNSIRGGANRKVLERIVAATLLPTDIAEHHGDRDLRYVEIDGKTENGRVSAGTGGSRGASHRGRAGRIGDQSLPGHRAVATKNRSGDSEMDAGHPAGRGHFAGAEKLPLAPAPRSGVGGRSLSGVEGLRIFNAWSDEPWVNDGAAVRVSLVCFGSPIDSVGWVERTRETQQNSTAGAGIPLRSIPATLDGQPVTAIHADLTGQPLDGGGESVDLTRAVRLAENLGACFMGASKKAPFDIPGELARSWLNLPNPHQRGNAEVLRPLWNGLDLTRRPRDIWIIDFGTDLSEADAALFERPFEYVVEHVKPEREKNNREAYRKYWWRHAEPRPGMRAALRPVSRYIATPEVSKHRIFFWLEKSILPDQKLYCIARSDDATFGILHSRIHEVWALAVCTWHGVGNDPRYTPTTTFETFPFPAGLTPADTRPNPETVGWAKQRVPINHPATDSDGPALGGVDGPAALCPSYRLPTLADPSCLPAAEAIARAAFDLNRLRETWLNPPEWVDWVITAEEEKAGFPKRPVAKPGHEADLKKRTLTNLYNARPAWLAMAHEALDHAVAVAYGWDDYTSALPDEEILRRLLALNQSRANA